MLTILIGPSGVGKNSVINALMARHPGLCYLKAVTTRAKRPGEKDAYIHVSKKQFEQMIERGEFFEYENVHADLMYGTLLSALEQIKTSGKNFIKDLDVHGAVKIQKHLGRKNCKTIFLDAPDKVLLSRLKGRGESNEMIKVRMGRYFLERQLSSKFDKIIENIDLDETVRQIEDFVGKQNLN